MASDIGKKILQVLRINGKGLSGGKNKKENRSNASMHAHTRPVIYKSLYIKAETWVNTVATIIGTVQQCGPNKCRYNNQLQRHS